MLLGPGAGSADQSTVAITPAQSSQVRGACLTAVLRWVVTPDLQVYRRPRGMFFSLKDRGEMVRQVLDASMHSVTWQSNTSLLVCKSQSNLLNLTVHGRHRTALRLHRVIRGRCGTARLTHVAGGDGAQLAGQQRGRDRSHRRQPNPRAWRPRHQRCVCLQPSSTWTARHTVVLAAAV